MGKEHRKAWLTHFVEDKRYAAMTGLGFSSGLPYAPAVAIGGDEGACAGGKRPNAITRSRKGCHEPPGKQSCPFEVVVTGAAVMRQPSMVTSCVAPAKPRASENGR
jgi:hypothetical protein